MGNLASYPKYRVIDENGIAQVDAQLWTYAAGTTAPKFTYSDAELTVENTNPVLMDVNGEAVVRLDGFYKFIQRESDGSRMWTLDWVSGDDVYGDFTVTGNTTLGGTLAVTGATTLASTLAVTGASTFTGAVTMANTLAVTGTTTFSGTTNLTGTVNITGSTTITENLDMGGYKIVSLGTPTADTDGATKKYVDDSGGGGSISISGTPVANDFARWASGTSLGGRSYAETLDDLSGQATATFDFNTQIVSGVVDPTTDQQVATKKYVDDNGGSLTLPAALTNATTGTGLSIYQSVGLAGSAKIGYNYAFYVYSDVAQTNSSLVQLTLSHSDTSEFALQIDQYGDEGGGGIKINQINTGDGILLQNTGAWSGIVIYQQAELNASHYGLFVHSNIAQTNAPLVYFHQQNASSTQNLMHIANAGQGVGLRIVSSHADAGGLEVQVAHPGGYAASFANQGNAESCSGIYISAGLDDRTGGDATLIQFDDGDGDSIGKIWSDAGVLTFTPVSDRRLKTSINPTILDGLTIVLSAEVVDFNWVKSGARIQGGMIAQDVQKFFPQAVTTIGENLAFTKEAFVFPLILAVQNHEDRIKELENEVHFLKGGKKNG